MAKKDSKLEQLSRVRLFAACSKKSGSPPDDDDKKEPVKALTGAKHFADALPKETIAYVRLRGLQTLTALWHCRARRNFSRRIISLEKSKPM